MAYALKAEILDPRAERFVFPARKTMYGGKQVAVGDAIYLFDVEAGLVAKGVVTAAEPVARVPGIERQTPRVSVEVRRTGLATRALGRAELRPHAGQPGPEAELDFKFYRQATPKLVGISEPAVAFLDRFF